MTKRQIEDLKHQAEFYKRRTGELENEVCKLRADLADARDKVAARHKLTADAEEALGFVRTLEKLQQKGTSSYGIMMPPWMMGGGR